MHLTTTTLGPILLSTLASAASITTTTSASASASTSASTPSSTVISYFGAGSYTFSDKISIQTSTSYAASVIALNALATTYQINCLPSAPTTDCTLATPLTLVAGPNTFSFAEPVTFSLEAEGITVLENGFQDMACTFTHSTEKATCTVKVDLTASGAGVTTSTTTTFVSGIPSNEVSYQALTVTGGLASFTAPAATMTPSGNGAVKQAMVTGLPLGAAVVVAALL